jgi:hypothetical protein
VPIDPVTGQPITGGYLPAGGNIYSQPSAIGGAVQDLPWIPLALVGGGIALAFFLTKRKGRQR